MEQDRAGKGQAQAAVAVLAVVDSGRSHRQERAESKAEGAVVKAWDTVREVAKQKAVEQESRIEKGKTTMPRGDGTGPAGQWPGTGRGQGSCGAGQRRGMGRGQSGRGLGMGAGRGQGSGQGTGAKLIDTLLNIVSESINKNK